MPWWHVGLGRSGTPALIGNLELKSKLNVKLSGFPLALGKQNPLKIQAPSPTAIFFKTHNWTGLSCSKWPVAGLFRPRSCILSGFKTEGHIFQFIYRFYLHVDQIKSDNGVFFSGSKFSPPPKFGFLFCFVLPFGKQLVCQFSFLIATEKNIKATGCQSSGKVHGPWSYSTSIWQWVNDNTTAWAEEETLLAILRINDSDLASIRCIRNGS